MPKILAERLVKRYGNHTAVGDVSLKVFGGEILGLLGPNGAGKTTTIEMMEGLRRPDSGFCRVCGYDSIREQAPVREVMGISLQATSLPGDVQVRELLTLYASFYEDPLSVGPLLEQFNLTERARARCDTLSGGQKQRLVLALALVGRPQVIFLDEPTTGLDPQARRSLWEVILGLKADGRAILLSTHYMEEAAVLCDRVAVMDHGEILATGTPKELVREYGPGTSVVLELEGQGSPLPPEGLPGVTRAHQDGNQWVLHTTDASAALMAVAEAVRARGLSVAELAMHTPTLEDVFLALTGRRLRD